jgi:hypothetical protein
MRYFKANIDYNQYLLLLFLKKSKQRMQFLGKIIAPKQNVEGTI